LRPAKINVVSGSTVLTKTAPFFSSGVLAAAQEAADAAEDRASGSDPERMNDQPLTDLGLSSGTLGCTDRESQGNTRVNQDCTFRFQAEEGMVFNPANPNNLLAGMNDGRVGFNQCGIAFSTDNGRHWGDMLPPFRSKVNRPAFEEPTAADPNRHTIKGGL